MILIIMHVYRLILTITLAFFCFFGWPIFAFTPKTKKVNEKTILQEQHTSTKIWEANEIDPDTVLRGIITPTKLATNLDYSIEIDMYEQQGKALRHVGQTLYIDKNIKFPYQFIYQYDKDSIKNQPRLYGLEVRVYENGRLKWRNVELIDPFKAKNRWRLEVQVENPFL